MTITVTHAFTSAKPDSGDVSLIQPSNWNAEHVVTGLAGGTARGEYFYLNNNQFSGPLDMSGDTIIRQIVAGGGWTLVDISGCAALEKAIFDGSAVITNIDASGCAALTVLTFDVTSIAAVDLTGCAALDFVGLSNGTFSTIDVSDCTVLTDLELSNNANLTTINLTGLGALIFLVASTCPSLTSVTMPSPNVITEVSCSDCAFTQAAVDTILIALDANGLNDGSVDIQGGTSSTPGASGIAAAASLTLKGWTVGVN